MRDVPPSVPSCLTFPTFTSQLVPRLATKTSLISPPEAVILRYEIVRLIDERLGGRTTTHLQSRLTFSNSRSLTVLDNYPGNALVLTRKEL